MQQKNPGTKGYPEYTQLDLPAIEKIILRYWQQNKIFDKSVESRPEDKRFVFYEGPPSANGKPGIHHVMSRTIKDLFCRFKTLQGYRVERKAGWDTHGLPVELGVEKQLGITKADIGTKITVAEYNRLCREDVMKYTGVWRDLTEKMGYWVDMDHPYVTYENNYIESLWALLKMLYDKDMLYEGYTIQPYSPAAGTGLSSHELNQPGCYRNVKDVSAVAMFKLKRNPKEPFFLFDHDDEDIRMLAWTTTPWTLPSNTALAVGQKINYSQIRTFNPYTFEPISIILARDLIGNYFSADYETPSTHLDYYFSKWLAEKADPTKAHFTEHLELKKEFQEKYVKTKKLPFYEVRWFTGFQLEGYEYEQLSPLRPTYGWKSKTFPGCAWRLCNHHRRHRYSAYRALLRQRRL